MREDMMVVGITAVDEETMKLELVPLITTKKKVSLFDVVKSGNTNEIIKAVQGEQQHRNVIFRSKEWVFQKRILPFCAMTLDLDTGDDHKEQTHIT